MHCKHCTVPVVSVIIQHIVGVAVIETVARTVVVVSTDCHYMVMIDVGIAFVLDLGMIDYQALLLIVLSVTRDLGLFRLLI